MDRMFWNRVFFRRYNKATLGMKLFGKKSTDEIKKEIKYWFQKCVGAYCIITEKEEHLKESNNYG